jgi:hypothetical protein
MLHGKCKSRRWDGTKEKAGKNRGRIGRIQRGERKAEKKEPQKKEQ